MRVMSTVDKCINRLDDRPKLRALMTDMGIRHQNYTVKMEYIDVSREFNVHSLKAYYFYFFYFLFFIFFNWFLFFHISAL